MLFVPVKLFWKACSSKAIICQFHDPELCCGLANQLCSKAKVIYDAHESYPTIFSTGLFIALVSAGLLLLG
jgi:hypothetical protein